MFPTMVEGGTQEPRKRVPLSDFIRSSRSLILAEWEQEVRRHPYSQELSRPRLLDHLPGLLGRMADMVETVRTCGHQSLDEEPEVHALERLEVGYDLAQVAHEYALLRACILQLYEAHAARVEPEELAVMLREVQCFNLVFDSAVSAAVTCYSRTRERTLVALDRISEAALGTGELETFLPKLLRVILESMESVDTVSLMLREDDTLRMRASVGVDVEQDDGPSLQVGEGFAGKVAAERRPLQQHTPDKRIRALYGVPLFYGGEVIGVARMGSLNAASFSSGDKLLLRTMVQRLSALLFQARLLEREQSQKRLLDAILARLPVGVAVAEAPSGHLILGNQTFEDIWRHPFIYSPSIADYREYHGFHPDGRPFEPYEWPMARAIQGEEVRAMEIGILRGDGTRGMTLQNAAPIRDTQGRIIAAVATALDITDRKAAEEQQRRLVEFRERFLGIVSHDLRNPLNAVQLSARAMLDSECASREHEKYARRILGSTERMGRMIVDLLDFTRGQLGGGFRINRQPCDLLQLSRHILEELEAGHPGRVLHLEATGDFQGEWDPDRLAQLLGNLGKNALDYSPEGTSVDFRLRDEGATVRLEVHNEGPPIPADQRPYIFEPFRQATTLKGRPASGLGLGLFIAQQIIQAHGGTLTVRSSEEAEGTTFTARLPRYGAPHELPSKA